MPTDVHHFEDCMKFLHFCNLEDRLETSSTAYMLMSEYALGHRLPVTPEEFIAEIRAWRREQRGGTPDVDLAAKKTEVLRRILLHSQGLESALEQLITMEQATPRPDDDLIATVEAALEVAGGIIEWSSVEAESVALTTNS